jgi:farnesyl diphosphate synthase
MRYGVLDGGKRCARCWCWPPATRVGPATRAAAMRAAVAVELIHAYSLVHDDMPCMDNDVLRRGKPTVHVQYGEAQAMLAGDAMQALAFEVLTPDDDGEVPPRCRPGWCACWPAPPATPAWPAARRSTSPASASRWTSCAA